MKTTLTIIIAVLVCIFCGIQAGYACTFPPTAILTVTPNDTALGVIVTFDGSDSFAQSGKTIVKYEWDFDGDGTYDYYEVAPCDGITTYAYTMGGEFTAKLRVTDNLDIKGVDTYTLFVTGVHNITQSAWYNGIQSALNDANNADEIEVLEGVWNGAIDFGGVNCVLRSSEPNNWQVVENTIIDAGDPNVNAVTFNSGENSNCLLDGFTIKGGIAGVYCDNSSSPVIKHCQITRNNSYGVRCVSGEPVITNNKIVGNFNAVGVSASSATPPVIKNSLVCKNFKGISLASANSAAMVRNNTIADNNSAGIEVVSGTEPNVSNCIVWNNTSDMNGCSATYSCISDVNDANGVGNFTSDPRFRGVDSNSYYLTSESPCVTSGDPNQSYTGEIDLYGRDVNAVAPQQGVTSTNAWKVQENGQGHNPLIWGTYYAFGSLQTALTDGRVKNGDEIWVAGSPAGITYKPGSSRDSTFGITKAITLYGGFSSTDPGNKPRDWKTNETILSGDIGTTGVDSDNCYHVVTVGNGNAVIDGFTITKGNAANAYGYGSGGGMVGGGTIKNCKFVDNKAGYTGGALYCGGNTTIIVDCTFQSNSTTTIETYGTSGGGAIAIDTGYNWGYLKVIRCNFISNDTNSWSYGGGAIFISPGPYAEIENCLFIGNSATYQGGAIGSSYGGGHISVTNCVFTQNSAYMGGAIFVDEDVVLDARNCTFYANSAYPQPYTYHAGAISGHPECGVSAVNSIFWNNTPYEIVSYQDEGVIPRFSFSYCDIEGGLGGSKCSGLLSGTSNIGDDTEADEPKFLNPADPLNHGFAIHKDSPCRDSGTSSGVDTSISDPVGNQRVYGSQIDIGAYEWAPYFVAGGTPSDISLWRNLRRYNPENGEFIKSFLVGADNETILCIAFDKSGNIVAGTSFGNVYKIKRDFSDYAEGWTTYTVPGVTGDPFYNGKINGLDVDTDGYVYVGYNYAQDGANFYNLTKLSPDGTSVAARTNVNKNSIYTGVTSLKISGNYLWVGTGNADEGIGNIVSRRNLSDLNPSSPSLNINIPMSEKPQSYMASASAIEFDTAGNLYFGTDRPDGDSKSIYKYTGTGASRGSLGFAGLEIYSLCWVSDTDFDKLCAVGYNYNSAVDNIHLIMANANSYLGSQFNSVDYDQTDSTLANVDSVVTNGTTFYIGGVRSGPSEGRFSIITLDLTGNGRQNLIDWGDGTIYGLIFWEE